MKCDVTVDYRHNPEPRCITLWKVDDNPFVTIPPGFVEHKEKVDSILIDDLIRAWVKNLEKDAVQ